MDQSLLLAGDNHVQNGVDLLTMDFSFLGQSSQCKLELLIKDPARVLFHRLVLGAPMFCVEDFAIEPQDTVTGG